MAIRISNARSTDAAQIARMSRILIENNLPWSWTEERVARAIAHLETAVIVARDRRRIAGFAIMYYGDAHAHLNLLAVLPSYRSLGVGRALVAWLEACARTAGIFEVRLEIRAANANARQFYSALGYSECGFVPGYYSGLEDACRMRRDLRIGESAEPSSGPAAGYL